MQHVWKIILDDDFKEVYIHGFVVECLDGRYRWFFPRIFTYSADYLEKYVNHVSLMFQSAQWFIFRIFLAAVWDRGLCPCPRCLIPKSDIHKLGQATDFASQVKNAHTYIGDTIRTARKFIYQGGLGINSVAVECVLKSESWTPTLVWTCQDSMTMLQTNH